MRRWIPFCRVGALAVGALLAATLSVLGRGTRTISLAYSGRPMPASPAQLRDTALGVSQLPSGWRRLGASVVSLASYANGRGTALFACVRPDGYLFGTTELTVIFVGPATGTLDTVEERMGRTPLPSLLVARREDADVGSVELACLKAQASTDSASSAFFVGRSDPVGPWDRRLRTTGVVSASQSTYDGETDTSIDVVRDGYFGRFSVTMTAGSPLTDELLEAAIARM